MRSSEDLPAPFGPRSSNGSPAGSRTYVYDSLPAAENRRLRGISRLPFCMKVLLENLLRNEDGRSVTKDDIKAVAAWLKKRSSEREIAFRPARVLMQDFTGVPAVVDLAAMRDAMRHLGGDPNKINPLVPVDLVIDHSVIVNFFGSPAAFKKNVEEEYKQNQERYRFLKWAQRSFENFRVVPPGTGICHQVNLEYLSRTVFTRKQKLKIDGRAATVDVACPDTVIGTDSHTTMVNGLSVLGWGVGGIEAEAAMLGQPMSMLLPEVIGFRVTGKLKEGVTATDLVLTVTQMLRRHGVVGKFVEFCGPGLDHLSVEDRATIGNMSPEYGATCGFFPIDEDTLRYLENTGRPAATVGLVKAYAKAQGLLRQKGTSDPVFTEMLKLDLATVQPSLAGPKRPQDRVLLKEVKAGFAQAMDKEFGKAGELGKRVPVERRDHDLGHGDVVIAAITSCTNTSNPSVMVGAGLLARNANEKGLKPKPWVKTSLAPGSTVVTDYLERAGLTEDLDKLGFNLVGYGCTTCIGNSGPLPEAISEAVNENDLAVTAVLSGNRNFEGRINPDVKMNYLASPPLVVAYALAGTMDIDLRREPLGSDAEGKPVYLADIWPSPEEVADVVQHAVAEEMFTRDYADVFKGDDNWRGLDIPSGDTFAWDEASTYVRRPPYFDGMPAEPEPVTDIVGARVLAKLGDSVTTDHISPAGAIKTDSPAGTYLTEHGVERRDFHSYGSRRGNHEVMIRGTFANIRLRNQLAPGTEGGVTAKDGEQMSIYDASRQYIEDGTPLIVLGGKEYGSGSSRDWAAKGTLLLGVRAVLVESFERIHRSNLIGMGVLPLQYRPGESAATLGLTGDETFDIRGIEEINSGNVPNEVTVTAGDKEFRAVVRIDTPGEADYYRHGGIMQYVLRSLR